MKKISKIMASIAMIAIFATACNKTELPAIVDSFSVEPAVTNVVFTANGEYAIAVDYGTGISKTFVVNSTAEWNVTSSGGSWLHVTKNDGAFTLAADANTLAAVPETATVTVSATGFTSVVITVNQASAKSSMSVEPALSALVFSVDGTTVTSGGNPVSAAFTVVSNTEWDVTSTQTWLHVTKNAGDFTLAADANDPTAQHAQAIVTVRTTDNSAAHLIYVTQDKDNTLILTESSLHFTSKAETPQSVVVQNVSAWTVVENLEWITTQKQGGNLIITAQPSRSLTDRDGVITVVDNNDPTNTAEIQVSQDHGTPKLYTFNIGGIPFEHLSANGRYVAGGYDGTGIVLDLVRMNDDDYVLPVYTLATNPELVSDYTFSLIGVSDNGTPFPKGVTADGSTTVKIGGSGFNRIPYLIKNGVQTQLDYPSTYMTGANYQGVYPDLISADGKYITGRINADGATWIACKWTLVDGNYVYSAIAPDYINYTGTLFSQFPQPQSINGLSVNGEYSCGVIKTPQGGTFFNPIPATNTPYFYNMATEAITVLDAVTTDGLSTCVTNDGTLFYSTPNAYPFGSNRTPYAYENGTKTTFAEWVKQTYDLDIVNEGFVSAISKDKSVVVWVTEFDNGNHLIVVEP